MLDQSDNHVIVFWLFYYFKSIFVISDLVNPFIFSENLILSFIDKVTTGT